MADSFDPQASVAKNSKSSLPNDLNNQKKLKEIPNVPIQPNFFDGPPKTIGYKPNSQPNVSGNKDYNFSSENATKLHNGHSASSSQGRTTANASPYAKEDYSYSGENKDPKAGNLSQFPNRVPSNPSANAQSNLQSFNKYEGQNVPLSNFVSLANPKYNVPRPPSLSNPTPVVQNMKPVIPNQKSENSYPTHSDSLPDKQSTIEGQLSSNDGKSNFAEGVKIGPNVSKIDYFGVSNTPQPSIGLRTSTSNPSFTHSQKPIMATPITQNTPAVSSSFTNAPNSLSSFFKPPNTTVSTTSIPSTNTIPSSSTSAPFTNNSLSSQPNFSGVVSSNFTPGTMNPNPIVAPVMQQAPGFNVAPKVNANSPYTPAQSFIGNPSNIPLSSSSIPVRPPLLGPMSSSSSAIPPLSGGVKSSPFPPQLNQRLPYPSAGTTRPLQPPPFSMNTVSNQSSMSGNVRPIQPPPLTMNVSSNSNPPQSIPPLKNFPVNQPPFPQPPANPSMQPHPPLSSSSKPLGPPPSSSNPVIPPTSFARPPGPTRNAIQQQPFNHSMVNQVSQQLGGLTVTKDGWNHGWGTAASDLLQNRRILPPEGVKPLKPVLMQEYLNNCSPEIFRCTLTKVPESQSVLQKSRMPFGILIHPFKDLDHLVVVSCATIVRCRSCRAYINPFVVFKGERRWECNLCFRVNEVPDEFLFDPVSHTYGDPSKRPEVQEATIEFIAPQEYMLRPPQPATYVYVLDVSRQAVETGYLHVFCETLLNLLDNIPGDRRTMIGFITFSTNIQFYLMGEGMKSVQMLEVFEIDDVFIPSPVDLLVNLQENRELIEDLLMTLPDTHSRSYETQTALGAAVTAAYKLISSVGGRITVMLSTLPTIGPGALTAREDPNQRSSKDVGNMLPATDFYKKLALDCSGQQIAIDLFTLNSQYVDLATLSGMSKFCGGSMYNFPGFHVEKNPAGVDQFRNCLSRYLTRKIGFESVMRIRTTRGISITHFHGNFFVRSTDLLALPNVNPDAGFGMQVAVEEPLHNIRQACFQAALLYTSSKGERRIRVHTLCLPVTPNIHEIIAAGDQQAIVGLLAKMAVDKSLSSQMTDAREALINACSDILSTFKLSASSPSFGLSAPATLSVLPLYTLALLKSVAFRHGVSTKLDERVFAMCEMKTMPLNLLLQTVYPDLFPIHNLTEEGALDIDDIVVPQPGRLQLSAEYLDRGGAYLMDTGSVIYIYVRSGVSPQWVNDVIGSPGFAAIPQPLFDDPLPVLDNGTSELTRNFVAYLQKNKPYSAPVYVIREDNPSRALFVNYLVDDRSEGFHSYMEFLQFIKTNIK